MDALKIYSSALADAFVSGDLDLDSLKSRGQRCLGFSPPWLENLCREIIQNKLPHSTEALAAYIYDFVPLRKSWLYEDIKHYAVYRYFPEQESAPPARYIDPSVARLNTFSDLCDFFEIGENHLSWLSDPWESVSPPFARPVAALLIPVDRQK